MSANTLATLNGFYKQIYGDSLINLIPESAKFIKEVPFERRKKLGDKYNVPVVLQAEQGFTYNDGDGTAFALNGALAMGTKNAQVRGAEKVLQSQISYKAAAAATSNKEAFADATSTLFENMVESMANRLELSCFYGNSSLGDGSGSPNSSLGACTFQQVTTTITVTTANNHGLTANVDTVVFKDDVGSVAATSGAVLTTPTPKTFTMACSSGTTAAGTACTIGPFVKRSSTTAWYYIDKAQWATGLWAGKVGAELQFYKDDNSTLINTVGITISSIDPVYKRIGVTAATSQGVTDVMAIVKTDFDAGIKTYFNGTKGRILLVLIKLSHTLDLICLASTTQPTLYSKEMSILLQVLYLLARS